MSEHHLIETDAIKGMAIISVIILHTLPVAQLKLIGAEFHIWQAVPIFFVIMGMHLGYSIKRHSDEKQLFLSFLKKKYRRIIIPYIYIYLLSFLILIIRNLLNSENTNFYHIFKWSLVGLLPTGGPGNYFVTILFESILFFPIIEFFYRKYSVQTLYMLFIVNLIFELVSPYISLFVEYNYLYSACIIRYLSALAIGLYLADDNSILSKRNRWIIILSFFSLLYISASKFFDLKIPFIIQEWYGQKIFTFFYAGFLVMIGIAYVQRMFSTNILNVLKRIGLYSYHIFLVQILWFTIPLSSYSFFNFMRSGIFSKTSAVIMAVIFNLGVCLFLGKIFFYLMTPGKSRLLLPLASSKSNQI